MSKQIILNLLKTKINQANDPLHRTYLSIIEWEFTSLNIKPDIDYHIDYLEHCKKVTTKQNNYDSIILAINDLKNIKQELTK